MQLYEIPGIGSYDVAFDGFNTYQAIGFISEDGLGRLFKHRHKKKIFKKIGKGLVKVAKKSYKVVKKVVPIAAEITAMIPGMQLISTGLTLADFGMKSLDKHKQKKRAKRIAVKNKVVATPQRVVQVRQQTVTQQPRTVVRSTQPTTISAVQSGVHSGGASPLYYTRPSKKLSDYFKIFDNSNDVKNADVTKTTINAMRG